MNDDTRTKGKEGMSGRETAERTVEIETRPEPIEVDLSRTALVIVDMQNVFAGRTESADLFTKNAEGALGAIIQTTELADAARAAAVTVIYLKMIKDPDRKGKSIFKSPEDAKIVDELSPLPGDVVIEKSCYSGFRGTGLEELLKSRGISYLIFTGIATNICVESTLRDAYFLTTGRFLCRTPRATPDPPSRRPPPCGMSKRRSDGLRRLRTFLRPYRRFSSKASHRPAITRWIEAVTRAGIVLPGRQFPSYT